MTSRRPVRSARADSLTDLRGLRMGSAESADGRTGVTVALFDAARPTVLDVRGGASCTYDTASLSLDATFGARWAIFFSGGSIFGLDAARGVRTRILETGGGHTAFRNRVRIAPISGATLFDLPLGGGELADYRPIGYEAAVRADRLSVPPPRSGAGAGAMVGKYLGRPRAMAGGAASASESLRGLGRVGVLAVVNAVGAVRDPEGGMWIAGARDATGRLVPPDDSAGAAQAGFAERGTTLGLVAVELDLERRQLQRIAGQVHAGFARAIRPFHSTLDGDLVFAVSTQQRAAPRGERRPGAIVDALGGGAARCAIRAVLRAVRPTRGARPPPGRRGAGAARRGGPG